MFESILITAAGIVVAGINGYAAVKAAKAEKNSRPVSNGAIPHLTRQVDRLERLMTDHLRDHANK